MTDDERAALLAAGWVPPEAVEQVGWATETIDSRDNVRGRLLDEREPPFSERPWVRPVFAAPLPDGWEHEHSRWEEPDGR